MSIKIIRGLIPLIFIFMLVSSNDLATARQTTGNATYLPLVTLNRNRWIGPYGGYITTTAIDPSNPQTIYAGSWGSGIFKSQDGGQSWQQINHGLDNLYINSLVINPALPSTLYAGTYKSQVYKSQDGGKNWVWSGTGMQDQAIVYSIAVDPLAPATIYAGARGVSNNGNPPWNGVVYKSVDAGHTWTSILMNIGGEDVQDWVYSIAINPTENSSVYVASHEHGPFRSNNYGTTWFAVHDGISDDSGRALIISPDTLEGTTMYYGVWHFDSVYKSLDGGNDWFLANHEIPYTKVYSMAIDPLHTENVYLATFNRGVMKTEDSGLSWQPGGLQDDFIYHLSIDPISTAKLYAGTAGDGLIKSIDSGMSWQHANAGIVNAMATKVIVSVADPNQLFASVYGAGVYKSTDHGTSWSKLNTGLGDKFVHSLVQNPAHPELLYALTDSGGLYQNNLNTGAGWVSIGQGLPLTSTPQSALPAHHPLATHEEIEATTNLDTSLPNNQVESVNLMTMIFAPSTAQTAYLGTGGSGVYISTDGGLIWQSAGLSGETIQSLAVDSTNPELVYAATITPGSVKISSNRGETWTDAELPVTFYSLAASPNIPGYFYAGTDVGLYLYQAGSWTQLGFADQAVTSISVDPAHPNRIFVGTTSGAYYSNDTGLTWVNIDPNLSQLTIQSIDMDPAQPNWLYISTKTHGIYQATIGN
jgi:photosystem II stability/assembly factor-like uncharacterized protein